jgi:hypothetical protein
MELHLIMPVVEPENITHPTACLYCNGKNLRLQQKIKKILRDTLYEEVTIYRYQCLTCHRTFRIYPQGVTNAQISQRIRGFIVSLYLMGYNHREVALFLRGIFKQQLTKSQIHKIIRSIPQPVSRVFIIKNPSSVKRLEFETTIILKCSGRQISPQSSFKADRITLTAIDLTIEEQEELKGLVEPIAKSARAQIVVSAPIDKVEGS